MDIQFMLEASLCAALDSTLLQFGNSYEKWDGLRFEEKLLQFTSLLQHVRKDIRLGGVVGMYQLLSSNLVSAADIS
jgi:hypothetical protein